MRFCYADPPYVGQAKRHYGDQPTYDGEVDHAALIARLVDGYPDGWALSASSSSLHLLLPLCPADVRIGAWVKPFTPFKDRNVCYAWEPVIWRGGRKRARTEPTAFDWLRASVTLKHKVGLAGAKPAAFCFWVFDLLGARPGDVLDDLFPGTGAVTRAWDRWQLHYSFPATVPGAAQAGLDLEGAAG